MFFNALSFFKIEKTTEKIWLLSVGKVTNA